MSSITYDRLFGLNDFTIHDDFHLLILIFSTKRFLKRIETVQLVNNKKNITLLVLNQNNHSLRSIAHKLSKIDCTYKLSQKYSLNF